MKIFKFLKNFSTRPLPRFEKYEYSFYINKKEIENLNVWSSLSHHETAKRLRNFKSQPYDNLYVLRNKKGFNTMLFIQKYDVIICDGSGIVIDLLTEVGPGYISDYYQNGYFIYFGAVGTINFYNIKKRDLLELTRRWISNKR